MSNDLILRRQQILEGPGLTSREPSGRSLLAAARLGLVAIAMLAVGAIGGTGCSCGEEPVDGGPSPECTVGTLDCSCDSDDECRTDLACVADTCTACVWGTDSCPCNAGACTGAGQVCDQTADTCRDSTACEQAGCAQFQLCEQPEGQDAVCLEDCEPGYDWNGINCAAIPSCNENDPGYFDCGDNRECSIVAGAVECGACINGTVEVNGVCLENDCEAICGTGRTCRDNTDGGPPVCGDCDPSFIENAAGDCIDVVTCADLVATNPCDSDEVCLEATENSAARCATESQCETGFVASPVTGNCSTPRYTSGGVTQTSS